MGPCGVSNQLTGENTVALCKVKPQAEDLSFKSGTGPSAFQQTGTESWPSKKIQRGKGKGEHRCTKSIMCRVRNIQDVGLYPT